MSKKAAAAILIRQAAAMVDGAAALLKSYGEDEYDYRSERAAEMLACAAEDLERAEEACK